MTVDGRLFETREAAAAKERSPRSVWRACDCAVDMANNTLNEEDTTSLCSFGSRADLHRLSETPMPSWIHVGEPVIVTVSHGGTRTGHIQFIGQTEFAPGNWVGVELDSADGNRIFCCLQ